MVVAEACSEIVVLCQRSSASGEVASDELASDDVDSGALFFRRTKLLMTFLLMTSSSGALSFRRAKLQNKFLCSLIRSTRTFMNKTFNYGPEQMFSISN